MARPSCTVEELDDDSWELLERSEAQRPSPPLSQAAEPLAEPPEAERVGSDPNCPPLCVSTTPPANAIADEDDAASLQDAQEDTVDSEGDEYLSAGGDSGDEGGPSYGVPPGAVADGDEGPSSAQNEWRAGGLGDNSDASGSEEGEEVQVEGHTGDLGVASGSGLAEGEADSPNDEQEEEEPEEVKQAKLEEAEALKVQGNAAYTAGDYLTAKDLYERALAAAPRAAPQRAVYLSNKAAAAMQRRAYQEVLQDCTAALVIDPGYTKALMRRAVAYEETEMPEKALQDAQRVVELAPGNATARAMVARLQPIVAEAQEKSKEKMIAQLKELGNSVLGHFGMSLDAFKAVQDPATGSYSISYDPSKPSS